MLKRIFALLNFIFLFSALNAQVSFISADSLLRQIGQNTKADEIVVFNFWATWCKPCVEELKYFIEADTMLKSKSVQFIFVSFDGPSEMKKVKKFIRSKKMTGAQYVLEELDLNTFINAVDPDWQGNIPYTIVLKNGKRKNHEFNFASLNELLYFINN